MPPAQHLVYPDWPACPADLVPLPQVEGPKLKPFDFGGGPQEIEFVEYINSGLHGHVVRARIHGQDYAIKLFRYACANSWYGPLECYNPERDHKAPLMALAPYSEPFYSECRAFGRLHETGRGDLALDCFGYVLLDEANERALNDLVRLEFNGDPNFDNVGDMRGDFSGPSGRPPPLRGIVKALGTPDNCRDHISVATARRILDDIVQLQQLGIVSLDLRRGQCVDWKVADFSTALTTPHFLMTPEILAGSIIPPVGLATMEYQLFLACIADYWEYEGMLAESNRWGDQRVCLDLFLFRGRNRYPMRRTAQHRNVPYTLVDPRLFDWKNPVAAAAAAGLAKPPRTSARTRTARLPRWYYPSSEEVVRYLRSEYEQKIIHDWVVRDGCIFPIKRGRGEICLKLNRLLESNGGNVDLTVPKNKALVEADQEARYMLDETFQPFWLRPGRPIPGF